MDGYFLAMDNASSTLHSLSDAQMKEIQPGDKEFNAKLYGVMNLRYTSDKFSFKLDKPLKPALDDFYKEPLNNRIPIQFGMEYMRDKLAGKKTEGQLVDELNEWRKIMNKSAGTN